MFSLCGRNALRCANRFSFTVGDIFSSQFNANVVRKQWMAKSVNDISDVCMIIELVCLRDNIFSLSTDGLNKDDINCIISHICTD